MPGTGAHCPSCTPLPPRFCLPCCHPHMGHHTTFPSIFWFGTILPRSSCPASRTRRGLGGGCHAQGTCLPTRYLLPTPATACFQEPQDCCTHTKQALGFKNMGLHLGWRRLFCLAIIPTGTGGWKVPSTWSGWETTTLHTLPLIPFATADFATFHHTLPHHTAHHHLPTCHTFAHLLYHSCHTACTHPLHTSLTSLLPIAYKEHGHGRPTKPPTRPATIPQPPPSMSSGMPRNHLATQNATTSGT